jgi:hypothetical protein
LGIHTFQYLDKFLCSLALYRFYLTSPIQTTCKRIISASKRVSRSTFTIQISRIQNNTQTCQITWWTCHNFNKMVFTFPHLNLPNNILQVSESITKCKFQDRFALHLLAQTSFVNCCIHIPVSNKVKKNGLSAKHHENEYTSNIISRKSEFRRVLKSSGPSISFL